MKLVKEDKFSPRFHRTAVVAPSAIVRGIVSIGSGSVVADGAVIVSQGAPVEIGKNCVVMEGAIIRGAGRHPCKIGDYVLIGPNAHVSGAVIETGCFIGTSAVVLNGARLGAGSVVAIHAVVHIDTKCPNETFIPIGHTATGSPPVIRAPEQVFETHRWIADHGFTKVVFGFDSSQMTNGEATRELCKRYSKALAQFMLKTRSTSRLKNKRSKHHLSKG